MEFLTKSLIVLLILLRFAFIDGSTVSSKFTQFCIVPDVIRCPPQEILNVTYSSKFQAQLGNEIPPELTLLPPSLRWNANPQQFNLFTMIDSDIPIPKAKFFFHWVIGNIPGDDVDNGETLASYVNPQPAPLPGNKPHRYTFLIFPQPGKMNFQPNLFKNRTSYNRLETVLNSYDICSRPSNGNFFLSRLV